jgi:hypothetical protein
MSAGIRVAVAIAAAVVTAACASPGQGRGTAQVPASSRTSPISGVCAGFSLSLAADYGGQPSAMEAAESFTHTDEGTGFPESGWHETGHDDAGVTLSSGTATLHAVQGPDGTWFVDSGHQC